MTYAFNTIFTQAGNESVAPFGEPMGTLLCPPWETLLSFLKVDRC